MGPFQPGDPLGVMYVVVKLLRQSASQGALGSCQDAILSIPRLARGSWRKELCGQLAMSAPEH